MEDGLSTVEREIPGFSFDVATESKTGNEKDNQDAFFASPSKATFGVFDGVGGEADGRIASTTARDSIISFLFASPTPKNVQEGKYWMEDALHFANEELQREGRGSTTATLARIVMDGSQKPHIVIGHTGDTRLGILRQFREGRKLVPITVDDGILKEMFPDNPAEMQLRLATNLDPNNLVPELRLAFARRNVITKSLPYQEPKKRPTILSTSVHPSDVIIVTSDGVHDNLSHPEIERTLVTSTLKPAGELVRKASAVSREKDKYPWAKRDDITAIVAKIGR